MIRLLIVDDEPLVQAGVKSMLNWNSCDIEICGVCSNGAEALQIIERFHPEIVITDIWMPVMDGLRLLKTCRERYGELPVFLMLTGHEDFHCAREAIHYGVEEYILKTELTAQSLERIISHVLLKIKTLQQTQDIFRQKKDFYENTAGKKMHQNVIIQVQRYMQDHCTQKLSLGETASAFGLSPNYLSTLFTKNCGCSFTEFRNHIKIEEAKKLLNGGTMKIYEIAEHLGFENAFYFSKVFKKAEGISPREYLHRKGTDKTV